MSSACDCKSAVGAEECAAITLHGTTELYINAAELPLFDARAQEAKRIGDEFLALEKYVNLNYLVSRDGECLEVDRFPSEVMVPGHGRDAAMVKATGGCAVG